MTAEELLQSLPDEVRTRRLPLPDAENAAGPWGEALPALEPIGHSLYCELMNDECVPLYFEPFSTLAAEEDARALLARNEAPLARFADGLRRGRLQIPVRRGWNTRVPPDFTDLREIARLLQLKCKLAHGPAQAEVAAEAALQISLAGRMLCNGEGILLDWLIGNSIWRIGLGLMTRLAERPQLPESVRERLRAAAAESNAAPLGYAPSLQADLCDCAVYELAAYPATASVPDLVERFVNEHSSDIDLALDPENEALRRAVSERMALRREWLRGVLAGHPRPLDHAATARQLAEQTRLALRAAHIAERRGWRQVLNPWERAVHRRAQARQNREQVWLLLPNQLWPSFPGDALGASAAAQVRREEYNRTLREAKVEFIYGEPPTRDQLEAVRERLAAIPNAFGRLLAEHLSCIQPLDLVRTLRAEIRHTTWKLSLAPRAR